MKGVRAMRETIKALCSLDGISGREDSVRKYIISQIEGIAEYSVDPLGNLIVFKKGKKTAKNKVMLDAHMDEVGFVVTYIGENGLLKFAKVGGINNKVIVGKNVHVGESKIPGVTGIVPIHLVGADKRREIPDEGELYIDIGASSKEEAEKYVSPGDEVCFESDYVEMGENFIKAKALDDRAGCAILLEIVKSEIEYDLWFSFSVQEEVGLRGAGAAAYNIKPDYALVAETTTAADLPSVSEDKKVCLLGEGATVSFMDNSTVYNHQLFKRAFEIAKEKGIKAQVKTAVAGGNNAGAIHKTAGGIKTLTVSVPCRYLHSPSCVINYNDAVESMRLLKALAEDFADA